MNKIATKLDGVYIIEPVVHGDARGYFMETWSTRNFEELGLNYTFVQDNQSFSSQKGILRGIHFQNNPMSQAKLVRVTKGAVMDVAVDLRKGNGGVAGHVELPPGLPGNFVWGNRRVPLHAGRHALLLEDGEQKAEQ